MTTFKKLSNLGRPLKLSQSHFLYSKKNKNQYLFIGLGNIGKKYFDEKYRFEGMDASIAFVDVETILHGKFSHEVEKRTATLTTQNHCLIFNEVQGVGIYEHLPLVLDREEDIGKATSLIKKFMQEYAEPFFDYWTDIRCFLTFIETEDLLYINMNVFAGYGMKKKMIIWKLCNHPRYEAFKKERVQVYEQSILKSPNDKGKQIEFKELLSFLKRLDTTKPLYEWDDSYLIAKPLKQ